MSTQTIKILTRIQDEFVQRPHEVKSRWNPCEWDPAIYRILRLRGEFFRKFSSGFYRLSLLLFAANLRVSRIARG